LADVRHEFCTLFDSGYLARALVLHRSLQETCPDFRLRAYCMDDRSLRLLERLALPNVVAVALPELEAHDPMLRAVKPTRSRVEYYWTSTPAVCLHALETEPRLEAVTYLDADLMFFTDPSPLFDELGDGSIALVPHRYAPRWKGLEEQSGTYNVEWLTFRKDERGLTALRWWRERCLEWCYARFEDGKFGDQRYLDDWPERFEGVHVIEHVGAGLAPWNVEQYRLEEHEHLVVDGVPLVFFHFHSLRLYSGITTLRRLGLWDRTYELTRGPAGALVWMHDYPLDPRTRELLWDPYIRRLSEAYSRIRAVEPGFSAGFVDRRLLPAHEAARRTRSLARRLRMIGSSRGIGS
jgi:hypothetical protein